MNFKVNYSRCEVEATCLAEKEVVSTTCEAWKNMPNLRMEKQSVLD